jgi:hypothetical protein
LSNGQKIITFLWKLWIAGDAATTMEKYHSICTFSVIHIAVLPTNVRKERDTIFVGTARIFPATTFIFCDFCALSPTQRKTILVKYTIIEENRTRVFYNWLQHFSRESLKKEFEKGGFTADDFYSDVCGTPFS